MYSTGIRVNASQAKVNINTDAFKMFMFVWLMRQYLCGTEMCASINRLVGTVCSTVLVVQLFTSASYSASTTLLPKHDGWRASRQFIQVYCYMCVVVYELSYTLSDIRCASIFCKILLKHKFKHLNDVLGPTTHAHTLICGKQSWTLDSCDFYESIAQQTIMIQ